MQEGTLFKDTLNCAPFENELPPGSNADARRKMAEVSEAVEAAGGDSAEMNKARVAVDQGKDYSFAGVSLLEGTLIK
jgi:hypothetical protein